MALAPTLYDFALTLHQVDRGEEQVLRLKTARHPSESLERVWLRLLAYCWRWEERLQFGPGLSDPDAPDLFSTDLTGTVTQWIRVGKADRERTQRVLDRNAQARVAVLFESAERLAEFAEAGPLKRAERLELAAVDPGLVRALAGQDARRAQLTVTVVEEHLYVDKDGQTYDAPLVRG